MYDYQAKLVEVHDGDTMWLLVDQGMYSRQQASIRLKGVFCPEVKSGTSGAKATAETVAWFHKHEHAATWPVHVVTEKDKRSFVRYIGSVTCSTCKDSLNDHLIGLGYTDPTSGQTTGS